MKYHVLEIELKRTFTRILVKFIPEEVSKKLNIYGISNGIMCHQFLSIFIFRWDEIQVRSWKERKKNQNNDFDSKTAYHFCTNNVVLGAPIFVSKNH